MPDSKISDLPIGVASRPTILAAVINAITTQITIADVFSLLTKTDVELSNADNTSDVNKPVSSATQTALNNKVDKSTGYSLTKNDLTDILKTAYDDVVTWVSTNGTNVFNHLSNTSNPHSVTKAQLGLGNVANSDTTSEHVRSERSSIQQKF